MVQKNKDQLFKINDNKSEIINHKTKKELEKMTQHITKFGKTVAKHTNFKKAELEKLLTEIIGGTSESGTNFKNIEVRDRTESPHPAKSTKIKVDPRDKSSQIITLRIQLVGCTEIWVIDILSKQTMDQKKFHGEIRKSSAAFCAEEGKRYLSEAKMQKTPTSPTPSSVEASADNIATPQPKEKRTRRNASSLIPDELILEILLSWMQLSKGVETIDQREFWGIALSLGVAKKDIQTVLAILKRKGVIEEIPIKFKPQIKIAQLGLDLLDKQKKQAEAEKLEAEKSEHLQKARTFPMRALSPLKKVRDLQSENARLEETREIKATLIEKIANLRAELLEQEKELARIEARERNHFEEFVRVISLTDPKRIAELIEIAKKSIRQKPEQ
jgi:hypothetical protein